MKKFHKRDINTPSDKMKFFISYERKKKRAFNNDQKGDIAKYLQNKKLRF